VHSEADLTIPSDLGDLVNEINSFIPGDDAVIDLPVGSYSVENAEERPVQDALDYFHQQQQESEYDFDLSRVVDTGDIVNPEDVFAKYSYLMEHVALEAVANKDLFAAYIIKVAGMTYLQAGLEFKFLKAQEDELSAKSKSMTEDAHNEYGQHIPLDIRMDIDAILAEVIDYKNKRAVVMAQIEMYEAQMNTDEPKEEKPAFEDAVAAFFGSIWAKIKKFGPKALITAGALMVLFAVVSMFNMGVDKAPSPKVHPEASHKATEQSKPKENSPAPVVDNKPSEPSDAVSVDGHEDIVPVQVDTAIVHDGDTLWDIAVAVYGDGNQWHRIWEANKDRLMHDDVRNATDAGHWIHAGQTLDIPGDAE
jgi:hypothetical protein